MAPVQAPKKTNKETIEGQIGDSSSGTQQQQQLQQQQEPADKKKQRRAPYREDPFLYRLVMTLASVVFFTLGPYLYWSTLCNKDFDSEPNRSQFWSAVGWAYTRGQILLAVNCVVDLLLLTSTYENLKVMKERGVSKLEIWGSFFHSYFFGMLIVIGICLLNPVSPARLDLALILRTVGAVMVSDLPFHYVHSLMHRKFPRYHQLHHCCLYPSWNTNLFFHPVDLMVEFSLPVTVATLLLSTDIIGQYDPFAAICAVALQHFWYSMGHDSTLKNVHYRHHKYISGNYFVYAPMDTKRDPKDRVRKLVMD